MNRIDYESKIQALLDDESVYKPILDKRRNPNTQTEKKLNKLLCDIRKEKTIHDPQKYQLNTKTYQYLCSTDASPATFHGLPKIHKPCIPLRPITNCVGSTTYNLSKMIARILSPLQGNSYTVKNSTDFAAKIKQHTIQDDEIMVSLDVVSLFTSIPDDLALEVASNKSGNDDRLTERTVCPPRT